MAAVIFRNFLVGIPQIYQFKDVPAGGDMFGCNRQFRNELLSLDESAQLFDRLVVLAGISPQNRGHRSASERQYGVVRGR